jgi:hypothetical protein
VLVLVMVWAWAMKDVCSFTWTQNCARRCDSV